MVVSPAYGIKTGNKDFSRLLKAQTQFSFLEAEQTKQMYYKELLITKRPVLAMSFKAFPIILGVKKERKYCSESQGTLPWLCR